MSRECTADAGPGSWNRLRGRAQSVRDGRHHRSGCAIGLDRTTPGSLDGAELVVGDRDRADAHGHRVRRRRSFPASPRRGTRCIQLIRPPAAAALAAATAWHGDPVFVLVAALLGGGLAITTHTTKLGLRYAIDASPEPVTNGVTSIDGARARRRGRRSRSGTIRISRLASRSSCSSR